MIRTPRVRLVLVVAALFALLTVPMVGARTVSSPSIHAAGADWLGATLRWVEDLVGLRQPVYHGNSGAKAPRNAKDDTTAAHPNGGSCIDPQGRPRPICL